MEDENKASMDKEMDYENIKQMMKDMKEQWSQVDQSVESNVKQAMEGMKERL